MDIEADRIIDGDMDVDKLQGDSALDLFALFGTVVDVGLIENKVVLFPVEQVTTPHVKDALHLYFVYLITSFINT